MPRKRELHHILDSDLRLVRWPKQDGLRRAALAYLATKFQAGHRYSETAVNALLTHWHVFGDPALLRRELFDRGFLDRTRDGRAYWLVTA